MTRIRIMGNPWGWSPRGIWHWLTCWAWPFSVHGVEVTSSVARVPLLAHGHVIWPRVYKRIVKIGPLCFEAGRFAQAYIDAVPHYYTAMMEREIRYPLGRWQSWRARRRNERIDRDNQRRADDRAMREGCS